MRVWWLLALLAAGCRLGFDARERVPDDARPDLPPLEAGATVTETWGEDSAAIHKSVTADTYVSGKDEIGEVETDLNFGASDRLDLDDDALPLVRFDLSALPAGTRVAAASLRVAISSTQHGTISLHRLTEAWTEGAGDGSAGAASWLERVAGTPWSSPGVGAPGSRAADVAASIPASAAGTQTIDLPPALVEGWIDAPAANFGVVLVVQSGDDTRITSREGTDGARPLLSITYLP